MAVIDYRRTVLHILSNFAILNGKKGAAVLSR